MPRRTVLKISRDIANHFPVRFSEWILCYPLLGWAWTLMLDQNTFQKGASFRAISAWADESTWSMVCFSAAFLRLIALVVNGTFRELFPYSPHLRGFASLVICCFWGQITLGIVLSNMAVPATAVWTGFFAYSGYMFLECWNLFRSWMDVGVVRAATRP